jgi:hypothetical protein
MTVPTNDNREQYQGNDSATVFPYAFRIFDSADLQVYLTEEDGMQSLLVEGTDYTVSGAGDEDGGNVTYPVSGDPLANGEMITILRVINITQETDLRNQGAYYPEVVEDALDRGRMIDQQLQEQLDRSLQQPEASGGYDAEGVRISNIGDATDPQDAVSKHQMDERFDNDVITKTSGQWDAKGKRLTNLSPPAQGSDAATKDSSTGYTDDQVAAEKSRIDAALEIESKTRADADSNESRARADGDANLQAQISGSVPLEASAFSPISWHEQVVGNSVTIPPGKNAWSFGPFMSVNPGSTVMIGEGSFWTIANGEQQ